MRELSALYGSCRRGEGAGLEELPVQYADYAVWQRRLLEGGELERQLGYWREALAGAPRVLTLAGDRGRPRVRGWGGETRLFKVRREVVDGLRRLGQESGATLFTTVLAAYQVLLSRYSGQRDVLVGTPVAGRDRRELEGLIGLFVNTLVMRGDVGGNPSFRELVGRTREVVLGAFSHQDVPFEKLVEDLAVEREPGTMPLVQTVLTLQHAPRHAGLELADVRVTPFGPWIDSPKLDLAVSLTESDGALRGVASYRPDALDPRTAKRLVRDFERLLAAAAASPESRIEDLIAPNASR